MDEYEGRLRFDMENDFEGGQWIGGEFYYRKRKEKPTQTKDDVIYGMFAAGSSDSDDYDGSSSSKKRRKKGLIEKADYSKPVNFVSTGTVMPNKEIDRQAKEEEEEEEERKKRDEDDGDGYDDDGYNPGLGLGARSSSSSGLGFSSSSRKMQDRAGMDKYGVRGEEKEDEEDEDSFLPTAFGKKIKEAAEQRRERLKQAANSKSLTGGGVSRRSEFSGSGVGSFEKHTKGIGMKLLEKMGYKGGGLGKNEQGIVAPIQAKLRPKNMGMGFNDYEESKNLPSLDSSSQRESKEKQQPVTVRKKEKEWKKQHAQARAKEYITAEELLALKEEQGGGAISQKILDLRGPHAKVLVNLENLNAEEEARESNVPMPELQHNIRLIVDLAKLDIEEFDRKLRNERETVVALHREKEKLQNDAALQKKQLDAMEEIARVLDRTEEENSSGSLTLDSLARTFGDLQSRFTEDYKLCNLSSIACSYARPLFIRVFQGWDPLQNPSHGKNLLILWKNLLQGGEECLDFSGAASPYAQLIMDVVLPAVRISGINTWQPRDPEPMLRFLELWEDLLSPSVRQSILDMIVMPKLSEAVDSWDPCRETIAIHSWVHPWLPLLREKLESLYQAIRIKLGVALLAWHPSDESAFTILNPWKTVFDPASWEQLIVRSILPKLHEVMQEFQVNPVNQKLDEFNWVKIWASVVPVHHMVNLFEVHFFSKWLQVLYQWLNSNPDFGQVEHWYRSWKNLIPRELLANERIRAQLNVATSMMLQAVEGSQVAQPGLRASISFLRANEQRQFEQQQAASFSQRQASMDGEVEMSLMEVIATYAREHDLLFMPKPGRFSYGHQIYGFGSISIVVDSVEQKIFALNGEQRSLVSLEQLLHMQNISGPKRR